MPTQAGQPERFSRALTRTRFTCLGVEQSGRDSRDLGRRGDGTRVPDPHGISNARVGVLPVGSTRRT